MPANLGVHPQTLRRWERLGKLPAPERTLGNHRRDHVNPAKNDAFTVGYVRVSSHDQKSDLTRQQELLKAQAGKPVDLVISDLGSGLNYKKTGFKRLLLLILQSRVKELILTHKDRLLRFGSEIIFRICKHLCFGLAANQRTFFGNVVDDFPEVSGDKNTLLGPMRLRHLG